MSNKITTAVKYMQMPNTPKQVLKELACFADDDGKAFPSVLTLAAATCLSERSVRNGIAWLVDQKLVSKILGNGGNNIYFIHPENFTGEYKYPANIKYAPLHEVPPCTEYTPASHATTPAPDAYNPCTTFHEPLHEVPTNHHITINNHQGNHQDIHEQEKTEPKPKKPKMTTLPVDFKVSDQVKAWANEKGFDRLDEHLENFVGYAIANAKKYTDWDQALMNAIRGNWAKLRPVQQPSYQTAAQQTANEQAKWNEFLNGGNQFRDVTPKKSILIEGVGHA